MNETSTLPLVAESPEAEWTLLCVDDEPNIVSALRRLFRGRSCKVLTALSGAEALELMSQESVDLIISDMRMPGMDGAQLLEQVRQRWPSTVRILLTGYADVTSTVSAINRGEVYRYITKPWNDDEILTIVRQAIELRGLTREKERLEALTQQQNLSLKKLNAGLEEQVAERTRDLSVAHDKLKKSYLTSIKAFSNLIELRGGTLVGHARRVADLARRTAQAMSMSEADQKELFIAGLLHDIGHIGLSDALLGRPVPRMSEEDLLQYRKHPAMGEQALIALDDMQAVATLIRAHHERYDGKGFPDGLAGQAIPLGARILAVADTFDDLQTGHLGGQGVGEAEARTLIARGRGTQFDPEVLDVFLQVALKATPDADKPLAVPTAELLPGMVLAKELVSREGMLLLAVGHVLSDELIQRLRSYELRNGLTLVLLIKRAR